MKQEDVSSILSPHQNVLFLRVQDFDALLEPFYEGKSLTAPIDTAKVFLSFNRGL